MDHHFTLHGIFIIRIGAAGRKDFDRIKRCLLLFKEKTKNKSWKKLHRNFLECALYLENASHAIAHRLHALVGPVDVIRDDENQIQYIYIFYF